MLNRLKGHLDDPDSFEEAFDGYDLIDSGWDGMVYDRRAADKVAPLIRWADAHITRNPRLAAGDYWVRRNHFSAILGDTVAGRHALQHLDRLFGQQNPYDGYTAWRSFWKEQRERERAEARTSAERRARLLDEVLNGSDARRLNTRINALTPPVEENWAFDSTLGRFRSGHTGHEPWLFLGNRERWLTIREKRSPVLRRDDPPSAQEVAFEALRQVHAEMFGPSGTPLVP